MLFIDLFPAKSLIEVNSKHTGNKFQTVFVQFFIIAYFRHRLPVSY